jgi:hypothetical protein
MQESARYPSSVGVCHPESSEQAFEVPAKLNGPADSERLSGTGHFSAFTVRSRDFWNPCGAPPTLNDLLDFERPGTQGNYLPITGAQTVFPEPRLPNRNAIRTRSNEVGIAERRAFLRWRR